MRRRLDRFVVLGIVSVALATAPGSGSAEPPPGRNRLAGETSPYLLEHAADPVWWWTWSPEALGEARRQDKPVFLSVGYSSCHWCHVMQRESFAESDVASALNASFISIVVDREERPDLDAVYLEAVEALSGTAGWPMTVLLTPDGKPFAGSSYLPHDKLLRLLATAAGAWRTDRAGLEAQGRKVSAALARQMRKEAAGNLDEGLLRRFEQAAERRFDARNGGFGGAPRFPPASAIRLLLRIHRRSGDPRALEMATSTLDAMARGGIRDHLGGGFHRYATDERWLAPHFEKTLYDQALLTRAYLEAFEATGGVEYAGVAREVLDYVLRDLAGPGGAFYSAEDADSEGEEGRFYLWREADLVSVLAPAERAAFESAYSVAMVPGLPRGAGVLHRIGPARDPALIARALDELRRARRRRVRPARDEKILADWNGLMIGALAQAGRVLGEPRYTEAAVRAADDVRARLLRSDGTLSHCERSGEAPYAGNLDDYVFYLDGLIELYEATFDGRWLDEAASLRGPLEQRFLTPRGDYYFSDGTDGSLLVREIRTEDDVIPAGNSIAALALLRLADLLLDPDAATRARAILAATPKDVASTPEAYPALLMALDYATDRSKEVAIVGEPSNPATRALAAAVRSGFVPNLVVAVGRAGADAVPLLRGKPMRNGEPTAYVCEKQVCQAPTTDPRAAATLAHAFRPLRK